MIVISDTTPIISLLKVGRLDLLQRLYKRVLIPQAVYRELTENPLYVKESALINSADFIEVMKVKNIKSVSILRAVIGLDEGESEALIMYDEQKANLLLMDERKGRSVAKQLNVRHIGTIGILMLAYDKEMASAMEVKRCVDTMLVNGIRLDKKICNVVMEHVGVDARY